MEHFLINSSVCLFVLWIFYKLVLENTSWHRFKRWYLLGSIVIAIAIPFVVVKTVVVPVQETPIFNYETPVNYDFQQPVDTAIVSVVSEEKPFDWKLLLIGLYALGVFIMAYRFVRNLNQFKLQTDDEVESYFSYKLVLRSLVTIPHSFINRIFVSKTAYKNNDIPLEILEHEKAHLDQKHSYDILLIELLLVVFWFHPVLYVLRYSMKLNHEFLADQAVLEKGKDTTDYQELLLSYSQQVHSKQLAHTFNYPIIKKRFQVMKTKTTFSNGLLRSIALMAVIAGLVVACGKTKETRMIDHNTFFGGMGDLEQENNVVYGIDVDGFVKKGTVNYNGIDYGYNIVNDTLVDLFFPDGAQVDIKKNKLHISVEYDSQQVLDEIKVSPEESKQKIQSGQLIFEERATIKGELKVRTLSYDELWSYNFTDIDFHKKVNDNVTKYYFYIFPDFQKTIVLPMNEESGFIELFGSAYSFEKTEDGVILKSKNGKVFDWEKFGYNLIEIEEDQQPEYIDLEYIKKNIPEATVITVNEKKYYYVTKNNQTNIYNLRGELQNHENKDFADIVAKVLAEDVSKNDVVKKIN